MGVQQGRLRSILFFFKINQESSYVVTSSYEKVFSEFTYKRVSAHMQRL